MREGNLGWYQYAVSAGDEPAMYCGILSPCDRSLCDRSLCDRNGRVHLGRQGGHGWIVGGSLQRVKVAKLAAAGSRRRSMCFEAPCCRGERASNCGAACCSNRGGWSLSAAVAACLPIKSTNEQLHQHSKPLSKNYGTTYTFFLCEKFNTYIILQ